MPVDFPAFTPVHVVTGFLGSGKTTLLARLLRDPALSDTAVLINEFGEIGLDHHLLERIDETMVLLASGCLCCTVRGELAEAIKGLARRRDLGLVPPFRRLVVETTGLADPLPVLTTITADPVLRHHFRVGRVIATVDAVNGLDQMLRQPETTRQIALADRLILTKTDLADAAAVTRVVAALRVIAPDVPLSRAAEETIEAENLLGEDFVLPKDVLSAMRCLAVASDARLDEAGLADEAFRPHVGDVEAFSLLLDAPIDWTVFGFWLSMLLHRHGAAILRVKGILNVSDSSTPVAIHAVQNLVHAPRHLTAWPDDDRRSKLVFILRGLDPAAIARSLKAFDALTIGSATVSA